MVLHIEIRIIYISFNFTLQGKCRAVAAYDQDAGPKKTPKSLINTDLEFRFPLYSAKLKRQTTDIDRSRLIYKHCAPFCNP